MTLTEAIKNARKRRRKKSLKMTLLIPDTAKMGTTDEELLKAAYKDMIVYGVQEGTKAGLMLGAIHGAVPGNDMLPSLLIGAGTGAGVGALTAVGVNEGILPSE